MEKVLLFPGCIYKNNYPHLVEKYLSVIEKLGIDVIPFDENICCGYIFRDIGKKDVFIKHGLKLVEKLESISPDTIVNLCPTCNRHFEKHLKRDCGLSEEIDVYHICRFLMKYLGKNNLDLYKNSNVAVGYQDPCWLGRRSKDYESPRSVIKMLGYELKDGENSRQFAGCCGFSGLVPLHHPELSRMVSISRIDYFKELGVDYIVTSCPRCYMGLKQANVEQTHILDFAELLDLSYSKG